MRKPDPDPRSRQALLRAATRLMLARSYAATSVKEVCRDAGLSKGSFFHYFQTKDDLGIAVLDSYLAQVFGKLDDVRAAVPDPRQRVFACLDYLATASRVYPLEEGCILGRFTQELAQTHPRFRERCASHFDRWITRLAGDLQAAIEAAGLARSDALSLARFAVSAFEGALILAKADGDAAAVDAAFLHTRDYFAIILSAQATSSRSWQDSPARPCDPRA